MTDEPERPLPGAGLLDRGVVRVGDTVRRPADRWTVSVHQLLRDLRAGGFDLAPEPRGLDTAGREVLSYLEGRDQSWPFGPEVLGADGARRLGRLAARLRTALAGCPCPPDARWQLRDGAPGPGESLQHGDLGPWNLLWGTDPATRHEVVGVIDWDFAGPGDPWYDTAHLAWFTVPFMSDERARARGFPEPPDRTARLRAFAAGAGVPAPQLVRAVIGAQEEYARRVDGYGADPGREPWATFRRLGLHENARADRRWTAAEFPGTGPPVT